MCLQPFRDKPLMRCGREPRLGSQIDKRRPRCRAHPYLHVYEFQALINIIYIRLDSSPSHPLPSLISQEHAHLHLDSIPSSLDRGSCSPPPSGILCNHALLDARNRMSHLGYELHRIEHQTIAHRLH